MSRERRSSQSQREVPKPPISEVLAAVTGIPADSVPTGTGWVRMHCPFHSDRVPSASVNHDSQRFRCFSCDRDGDGLDLLMNEQGLDWREAVDRAKQLGGTTERRSRRRRRSALLEQEFG